MFDVDWLEFILAAKLCLVFQLVLYFYDALITLHNQMIIGIKIQIETCFEMLQVNFFLIFN